MIRRLVHPVLAKALLIAALSAPIALPAGAVVCIHSHGNIAIELADSTTGRCTGHDHGHDHDHCHGSEPHHHDHAHDSCCEPGHAGDHAPHDHGCVDLVIPADLLSVDRNVSIDPPCFVPPISFERPAALTIASLAPCAVEHAPPWVRPALQTFILLT